LPGLVRPMRLETNAVEYINHDSALYKNTKRIEKVVKGLSVTEVWLQGKFGMVTDADVLRGLDQFAARLEKDPMIGSGAGPTTSLRMMRYVKGQGDQLPNDEAGLEAAAADLEALLPTEPMLQRFIDKQFAQTHLVVVTKTLDYDGYQALQRAVRADFDAT